MKKLSTIMILSAATFALATASFAGAVPNSGGSASKTDTATIAQLQIAAKQALADWPKWKQEQRRVSAQELRDQSASRSPSEWTAG